MSPQPPFYPYCRKYPGDRVKLPKHPASANTEFWYGTINNAGRVIWDNNEQPDHAGKIIARDFCLISV